MFSIRRAPYWPRLAAAAITVATVWAAACSVSAQSSCGVVVRGAPDDAGLAAAIEASLAGACTIDSGGVRAALTFLAPDAGTAPIDVIERARADSGVTTLLVVDVVLVGDEVSARLAIAASATTSRLAFVQTTVSEMTQVLVARTSILLHEARAVAPALEAPPVVASAAPVVASAPSSTATTADAVPAHATVAAPLAGRSASPIETATPAPRESSIDPMRARVGLGATVGTGGWGYGLAGRFDVGVASLPGPFAHALAAAVDVTAAMDVGSTGQIDSYQGNPSVGAFAAWRAALGPVETIVRVGVCLAFPVAWLDDIGGGWRADVWLRGSAGVSATLHIDDFRPFVALDSYFGAGESFVLSLGVVIQ